MKVLNLYACLGGNRLLWTECEVTAVENDPHLTNLYKERFPDDEVIKGCAHKYLLNNYQDFDFIWTSPPCPTHSRARYWRLGATGESPVFADMTLYQEILFLEKHFDGKWVAENVVPYYEPLIPGYKRGRHMFWANFAIPEVVTQRESPKWAEAKDEMSLWKEFHDFDFKKYEGKQRKSKIARNMVDYHAGLTIYKAARGNFEEQTNQTTFFEKYEEFTS